MLSHVLQMCRRRGSYVSRWNLSCYAGQMRADVKIAHRLGSRLIIIEPDMSKHHGVARTRRHTSTHDHDPVPVPQSTLILSDVARHVTDARHSGARIWCPSFEPAHTFLPPALSKHLARLGPRPDGHRRMHAWNRALSSGPERQ